MKDTIGKHWLLNLANDHPIWLGFICPNVEGMILNARAVPGFEGPDYARCLRELKEANLIRLIPEGPGLTVESGLDVDGVLDQFASLRTEQSLIRSGGKLPPPWQRETYPGMNVSFELTAAGGVEWETLAEPDWGQFIDATDDFETADLISANRNLLIAYMGWYSKIRNQQIRPESIRWSIHEDFPIRYWKKLPRVYHASFELQPGPGTSRPTAPAWFQEWESAIDGWYKKPWHLPGWPAKDNTAAPAIKQRV